MPAFFRGNAAEHHVYQTEATRMDPSPTEHESSPGECQWCGTDREGHSYVVLYGDWDADQNGFSRPPCTEPLCQSCWQEHYERVAGAYYEVPDGDRLWDILSAANGDLVADLVHLFVGGRPFVRVVDDDPQVAKVKPTETGDNTIRFEPEVVEDGSLDREWLTDLFDRSADDSDNDVPNIAVIRPVEETPFGDARERGGDSQKLTRWSNGE